MLRLFLPLLIPVVLLGYSFYNAGVYQQLQEYRGLQKQSTQAEQRLAELQAVSVSHRYDQKKYNDLLKDFADVTGLQLSAEHATSKGESTAQIARFVEAVTQGLRQQRFTHDERAYLVFKSITPGTRQVWEPFFSVDFELNLEGRFFALPDFMALLSVIADEQKVPISIGELRVQASDPWKNSGELSIVVPLRAYFHEP